MNTTQFLLNAAGWFILGWIVLVNTFMATMHAKHIEFRVLPWPFRVPMYMAAIVGLILDFLWNCTGGVWIFRESPRELLFSSRVKRHYRNSHGERKMKADYWAFILNIVDEGHIK